MVNNNFTIVGTFISNFDLLVDNGAVKIYQATIEIEKNRIGGTAQVPIKVFDLTKGVDFKQILKGKLAIVGGRIDINYNKGDSTPNVSLIADSLKVLSGYESKRTQKAEGTERDSNQDQASV